MNSLEQPRKGLRRKRRARNRLRQGLTPFGPVDEGSASSSDSETRTCVRSSPVCPPRIFRPHPSASRHARRLCTVFTSVRANPTSAARQHRGSRRNSLRSPCVRFVRSRKSTGRSEARRVGVRRTRKRPEGYSAVPRRTGSTGWAEAVLYNPELEWIAAGSATSPGFDPARPPSPLAFAARWISRLKRRQSTPRKGLPTAPSVPPTRKCVAFRH